MLRLIISPEVKLTWKIASKFIITLKIPQKALFYNINVKFFARNEEIFIDNSVHKTILLGSMLRILNPENFFGPALCKFTMDGVNIQIFTQMVKNISMFKILPSGTEHYARQWNSSWFKEMFLWHLAITKGIFHRTTWSYGSDNFQNYYIAEKKAQNNITRTQHQKFPFVNFKH